MPEDPEDRIERSALPSNAGRLLLELIKENQIGPLYIRKDIVEKIDQHLRNRQHVILVGEPGTGKNACVEGLALKWLRDAESENDFWSETGEDVLLLLDKLYDEEEKEEIKKYILPFSDILETTYTKIIEGCYYSGNLENKISLLFRNCARKNILLFFDNIHLALITQTGDPQDNVFNFMVDSLPRDKRLVILATTTPEGYRFLNTLYPEKISKFVKIEIPETSIEETLEILKEMRVSLEEKYNVKLPDRTLIELIRQFGRFLFWRKFPGKAFESLEMVANSLKKSESKLMVEITPEDIRSTIKEQFGLNPILIDKDKPISKEEIKDFFQKRIFEQEEAVEEVVNSILRFRMQANLPKKPVASFLFAGPSGVGKTELAKVLAEYLFGSEKKLLTFSMSLFLGSEGVERLLGGKRRFSYEEGRLLKEVSANPFSVILLDEIDQASPSIINALYQILDEGRLVDDRGVETPFYSSILIATTNIGCEHFFLRKVEPGFKLNQKEEEEWDTSVREKIMNSLSCRFGDPFLNRFSSIVIFYPLSLNAVKKIALANIKKLEELPGIKEKGIKISLSEDLLELLAEVGYDPTMGARVMERTVTRYILNPLVSYLSEYPQIKGEKLQLQLEDGRIWVNSVKNE